MKKFIFLILFFTCSQVFAANSWQLATKTQLQLTTPANKKIKSTPLNGFEFATFFADGSYVSSEWLNRLNFYFTKKDASGAYLMPLNIYGQYSNTGNSYAVTYDKSLLSFTDGYSTNINAAFFNRIGISQLITTAFGGTPTIDGFQVISYSDSGNTTSKSISGTKKMVINVSWKNGTVPMNSSVTLTETYTGKPFIQSACCGTDTTQNATDSDKFMTAASTLQGVKTTASGLKYVVLQDNPNGATPTATTDTATVNYRGYLPSGTMFDSNSAMSFQLNGVIAGWTEGLQLMKKGSKYRFFIPSNLAYGQKGNSSIPGNSALVFDVELLDITAAAAASTATTP